MIERKKSLVYMRREVYESKILIRVWYVLLTTSTCHKLYGGETLHSWTAEEVHTYIYLSRLFTLVPVRAVNLKVLPASTDSGK